MKRFIILALILCTGQLAFAQWGGIGSGNPWVSATDPSIQSSDPDIEFRQTDPNNGEAGFKFANKNTGDANYANESFLFYDYGSNELSFGTSNTTPDDNAFNVNLSGRMELRGTSTRSINFMDGSTQDGFIQHSTGDLFIETNIDDIFIDAESEIRFLTDDNQKAMFTNSGELLVGTTASKGKLTVENGRIAVEAITSGPFLTSSTGLDIYNGTTNKGGISYFQGLSFAGDPSHSISLSAVDNGVVGINTEGSRRVTVDRTGNVGINDSTPSFDLDVNGDGNFTGELTAASDLKLKRDIIAIESATETINRLNPVTYEFRSDEFPELKLSEGQRWGLIAQEVESVLPDLVSDNGSATHIDGEEMNIKSVNYIDLIPMLIKAIQEQDEEIKNLKASISKK